MNNKINLKYGDIDLTIRWPFNEPTKEIFESWKKDFLNISGTELFDIYLTGSFREKLIDDDVKSRDVDIVLTGCSDDEIIDKLLYEGTKLGFKKYNTFFDILWFDKLPIYCEMEVNTAMKVEVGMISPELIINGFNQNPTYKWTKQISNNLWKIPCAFPSRKQMELIKNGYVYKEPMLINEKA